MSGGVVEQCEGWVNARRVGAHKGRPYENAVGQVLDMRGGASGSSKRD
jgi:hypothetical protein